ncbi:MAG TPA: hypothetical protein GXZ90_01980 [Clostridiales bacterium]|nr:hypothetical protein [Clostridiales bacterium]
MKKNKNINDINVLWFSRHELTEDQVLDLQRIYGNDITISQVNRTINSAYELADEIKESDVIAIVAPINLQSQFLKLANGKPVISARSKRIILEDGEKVEFLFDGWYQIEKIEVVTKDL